MRATLPIPGPGAASPAVRAARGGLAGRRVQAMVIGLVVLVSTAACTLALGLLVDSNAPFDHAFAAQHGAQVMTTATPSAQLAATTRLPGVTAAAGPFAETTVNVLIHEPGGQGQPPGLAQAQLTVVGRASPGGPVDDLTLTTGRWPRQNGEIVLERDRVGAPALLGMQVTVTGVPGSPQLTVVGFASSITGTAQAWVLPAELTALRVHGAPAVAQMLYRFTSAGTSAEVNADIAVIRAALPHGTLLGAQSYLTVKLQATGSIAPWVPFIVAFGLIGLVMSVLIVANVVSGAVVAGTRRIGVLKSIGFSPGQVVAAYLVQVAVPGAGAPLAPPAPRTLDAGPCGRAGGQPLPADGSPALVAAAVPALRQPLKRGVERRHLLPRRLEQRGGVLALERERRALRVVLVVGPSRTRRLRQPGELPLERRHPLPGARLLG
jgi:putative ABC transport system permease protein